MQRPQLEHIIRAAAAITGATDFVVIGSQAILGQFPDPPEELLVSMEADVFTFRSEMDAELIDGRSERLRPSIKPSVIMPMAWEMKPPHCHPGGRSG